MEMKTQTQTQTKSREKREATLAASWALRGARLFLCSRAAQNTSHQALQRLLMSRFRLLFKQCSTHTQDKHTPGLERVHTHPSYAL